MSQFFTLSVCRTVSHSVRQSVFLSVCLSVCLHVGLFVCTCLSVCVCLPMQCSTESISNLISNMVYKLYYFVCPLGSLWNETKYNLLDKFYAFQNNIPFTKQWEWLTFSRFFFESTCVLARSWVSDVILAWEGKNKCILLSRPKINYTLFQFGTDVFKTIPIQKKHTLSV